MQYIGTKKVAINIKPYGGFVVSKELLNFLWNLGIDWEDLDRDDPLFIRVIEYFNFLGIPTGDPNVCEIAIEEIPNVPFRININYQDYSEEIVLCN